MKSILERIVFNPKENRLLTIIMGALLLGFAWQIRGSGTSDPSVVAVLFLLFLVSPAASYITGQDIAVDGGVFAFGY